MNNYKQKVSLDRLKYLIDSVDFLRPNISFEGIRLAEDLGHIEVNDGVEKITESDDIKAKIIQYHKSHHELYSLLEFCFSKYD